MILFFLIFVVFALAIIFEFVRVTKRINRFPSEAVTAEDSLSDIYTIMITAELCKKESRVAFALAIPFIVTTLIHIVQPSFLPLFNLEEPLGLTNFTGVFFTSVFGGGMGFCLLLSTKNNLKNTLQKIKGHHKTPNHILSEQKREAKETTLTVLIVALIILLMVTAFGPLSSVLRMLLT